jgi:hypothetical protein
MLLDFFAHSQRKFPTASRSRDLRQKDNFQAALVKYP